MNNAKDIFLDSIELNSNERHDFIREASNDNKELIAEVLELHRFHENNTSKLLGFENLGEAFDTDSDIESEITNERLHARYELGEVVGRGAFGVVYRGLQKEPVNRPVAIKLLKKVVSEEAITRFKLEYSTMARMNHPNIARIFDAGASQNHDPFLVMELIDGIPITEYCQQNKLTVDERLKLFIEVCRGFQHAHQKGCIHRDIKPNNVLVTIVDGEPTPKIIDFGVARWVDENQEDQANLTEEGQIIGSLVYMAPEMIESCKEIDTRSDIYSLGILLNELLTGSTPFSDSHLRSLSYKERFRYVCEFEPERLSTQFSAAGSERAGSFSTNEKNLVAQLRGDLDWIVLKCLDKEPDRRYESVNALIMDLDSHLNDQPVAAGPPTAAYRMRKFLKRNRLAVVVGSLMAISLVVGLIGTSAGLIWAARENERALLAESQEIYERNRADETKKMISTLFQSVDTNIDVGYVKAFVRFDAMLKQILDETVDRLDSGEIKQAKIQGDLRRLIADAYLRLEQIDEAEQQLAKSKEFNVLLDDAHPELLSTDANQAKLLSLKGKTDEALSLYRSTLMKQTETLGKTHEHTLESKLGLAALLDSQGKYVESTKLYEEVVDVRSELLGDDHPKTLGAIFGLAQVLYKNGDDQLAEKHFLTVFNSRCFLLGKHHTHTLVAAFALAKFYSTSQSPYKGIPYQTLISQHILANNLEFHELGMRYRQVASQWERYEAEDSVHTNLKAFVQGKFDEWTIGNSRLKND